MTHITVVTPNLYGLVVSGVGVFFHFPTVFGGVRHTKGEGLIKTRGILTMPADVQLEYKRFTENNSGSDN